MGKLTIQDLTAVLTEKNGLGKKEAQQFVAAMFDIIQEGIERDKLVKVKGLGTFKVIGVEARESVNVNTGERVLIDSHMKVTFTPDAMMKELVNKPFSGFETVVLNEGVDFDDMSALESLTDEGDPDGENADTVAPVEKKEDEPQPAEEPAEPEKVQETVAEPEEIIAGQEEPIAAPEEETVAEPEEETVDEPTGESLSDYKEAELPPKTAQISEEFVPNDETIEPEPQPTSRWMLWLLLAILACGLSFAAGFWTGHHTSPQPAPQEKQAPKPAQRKQNVAKPAPKDTLAKVATADTLKQQPPKTVAQPEEKSKPEVQPSAEDESYKKYEAMDNRVRYGAYRIIGTDFVVTAREGDTAPRIARRTLGEGMSCYIEVYNGITASTKLTAGQEVKIPKLKLKKKIKKNNQQ